MLTPAAGRQSFLASLRSETLQLRKLTAHRFKLAQMKSNARCSTSSALGPLPGILTAGPPGRHRHDSRFGRLVAAPFARVAKLGISSISSKSEGLSQGLSPQSAAPVIDDLFKLACPICAKSEFALSGPPAPGTALTCGRCSRSFDVNEAFVDLTLTSGVEQKAYREQPWLSTAMFSTPLLSHAYERGYRQNPGWRAIGFQGPEAEFEMAMEYLEPALGEVVLDVSCASGVFSRRFATSQKFTGVIASDFSGPMLQEASQFIKDDPQLGALSPIVLVRADVGRLPFPTASLAAVHAGAAIHCWPNPVSAFAEISRVLKPGGVFVASTVLKFTSPLGTIVGDERMRPLDRLIPNNLGFRFWEEQELRDVAMMAGLQDFQCCRERMFIMLSVRKPIAEASDPDAR